MNIFTLIRAFQKAKGRSPSPNELAQLKKQAEAMQPSNVVPFQYKRSFGDEVDELIKKGDVTIGTAPKTTKKKPSVDPKFQSAVKAQDERSESFAAFKKRMEAKNKEAAFNIAFKRYKDIDKKPLEMDEVISIYTNLNKYPKGRSIIFGDIAEIERGHILPNIGNRNREMIVNKLNKMVVSKKQPNPFKKAPDKVEEQIEMDFTDWDPKGMKGGGLAYMLGYAEGGEVNPIALRKKLMEVVTAMQTAPQEEIPILALEARRIRQQLAKFEQEEPSIMEAAEEIQEGPKTLEERIKEKIYPEEKVSSGATIYAPGTMTSPAGGEKIIDDQITIKEIAKIPNYTDMYRPVRASMKGIDMDRMMRRTPSPKKGLEALKELIRGDITQGDTRSYENGGRVPMMYGGDPGFAFEYGGSWADWNDNHKHMMPLMEYIGTKLPKDRMPFRNDRQGYEKGGMSRRGFLKLMGGLASIPILGKYFKFVKPAAKAVKAVETSNAAGMPAWFPKLVDKVIKDGKDVTKQYGTIEREIVHIGELPNSKTKIMVTQDLTTGNTAVDIGMGKHGWESGRHGQPARLELNKGEWTTNKQGKGVKTKDEFYVEEAEFTGDAENIKYEDSSFEKYGDHASDFSEVEYYATGKNVDEFNLKGTKKREADDFAEGRAEMQAEQAAEEMDEFASGGLAHMLGR
jgi:hypothetical protein